MPVPGTATLRAARSSALARTQITRASSAPGTSRRHDVRSGTLTWYSVASSATPSRVTSGQYGDQEPVHLRRQRPPDQGRADQHQRQRHRPEHEHQQVDRERQQPGAHDAAVAAQPVHDRDRVEVDVQRPRAGPQRQHETDRDQVVPRAVERVLEGGDDHGVDDVVGEERRQVVAQAVLQLQRGVGAEPGADPRGRAGSPSTSGGSDSSAKNPASAARPVTRYRRRDPRRCASPGSGPCARDRAVRAPRGPAGGPARTSTTQRPRSPPHGSDGCRGPRPGTRAGVTRPPRGHYRGPVPATHLVTNQVPALSDQQTSSLWDGDAVLREAVERHGAGRPFGTARRARRAGRQRQGPCAWASRPSATTPCCARTTLAEPARRGGVPPGVPPADARRGRHGLGGGAWSAEPGTGAHVARSAAMLLWSRSTPATSARCR